MPPKLAAAIMLILFDQNVPRRLRRSLQGHQVRVSADLGWGEYRNGMLLSIAEQQGYDLLITADQNIRYQQSLSGRRISLLVLGANRWSLIEQKLDEIRRAVDAAKPGFLAFIEIPLPPRKRRSIP